MSAQHNYNETQMKILAIIPHITGTLSALGSFSIICDIWKNRDNKMKRPYYRILLGLSLFDFLASTSLALSTIPMPADTPGVFGAKGTTQTCTAAGFFVQLSEGSMIYNLILSIYYTLSGRYKMTDDEFAKKCEPYMHGFTIIFTLGIAIGKNTS